LGGVFSAYWRIKLSTVIGEFAIIQQLDSGNLTTHREQNPFTAC